MIGGDTVVFLTTVFILLVYYFKRRWNVLKKWGIPHDPPSLSHLGHQSLVLGYADVPEYYLKCKRKYGKVWGYYIITEPWIVVHEPELLKKIMIKDSPSSFPNRSDRTLLPIEDIMYSGLVLATGEQWKRIRATLSPAFTSLKLRDMAPMIIHCIKNTLEVLAEQVSCGANEIKVADLCGKLSLDVICATAFGTDVNSPSKEKERDILSTKAGQLDSEPITRFPLVITRTFPSLRPLVLSVLLRRRKENIKYLRAFCDKVAKRRQDSSVKNPDLLQLMLDSRIDEVSINSNTSKGLTDFEIAANSITMLMAGRTTVSNAMTYLAYNLAMYPKIQSKLQHEIDSFYAKYQSLDWTVVSQIKYLEMCILESLRLYCPFSRVARQAKHDVEIGQFRILKGTSIDIPIQALSRDPEYWANPLEYDPERFRDMSRIDAAVYQPFGNGPRHCVGKRMAIMEMKLFASALLQKYDLLPSTDTPKPPLPVVYLFSATPKSPVKLKIEPRVRATDVD